MTRLTRFTQLFAALALLAAPCGMQAQTTKGLTETDPAFYKTEEARRIGDQVLIYQRCTGGWPKNIDMSRRLTDKELAQVMADKARTNDSTTDNGATTTSSSSSTQ